MDAIIIAGGEGSRLRPITYEIPKPLIPIQNKPVIQYLVENFMHNNINNIYIIINKEHKKKFEFWCSIFKWERLGKKNNTNIHIILEENRKGTMGGVIELLKKEKSISNNIIITNADELKDINIKEFLKVQKKYDNYIVVKKQKSNLAFGNVKIHKGKVCKFLEKKDIDDTQYISLGFYNLDKETILKYYYSHEIKEYYMFEKDLFPYLVKNNHLGIYIHKKQFFPIDTIEKWETAILQYKHKTL